VAVHIYTQTIHRTTQFTTLVGRLSGIRTHNGQTKINVEPNLWHSVYLSMGNFAYIAEPGLNDLHFATRAEIAQSV
jgi:hypothetical protein